MNSRIKKIAFFNKIAASIQSIVNLGYPEIIAKIFIDRFGENAHVIARWMNDYHTEGLRHNSPKDWLMSLTFIGGDRMRIALQRYLAAIAGEEEYDKWAEEFGYLPLSECGYSFATGESYPMDIKDMIKFSKEELEERFNKDIFFDRDLIRDIVSGALKDVKPYKKLSYYDARDKYLKKKILFDYPEIMAFEDGYRWVDVGRKCDVIGKKMKNCGSTGVMGMDKDRVMLTLLDKSNNPHIVATLHPNEKRISGFEGAASSAPKQKYHKYILNLIDHLGVRFEEKSGYSKSAILDFKYLLRDLSPKIEKINSSDSSDEYFKININDTIWFASPHFFVSEEDALKIFEYLKNNKEYMENKRKFSGKEEGYDFSYEDMMPGIIPGRSDHREKYEKDLGVKFHGKHSKNLLNILSGETNIDKKIAALSRWLIAGGYAYEAKRLYSSS